MTCGGHWHTRQCLGEEKCRHYNIYWRKITSCELKWLGFFLFYTFKLSETQNAMIPAYLILSSYLWGKPELSCHEVISLLALITQSRSEGRAKLFYKWGECDCCSLHTRPHGIRHLLTPDKISGTHQWWYFMTNEGWRLWIIIIEEVWSEGAVKWMLHLCDILWCIQTELCMWHGWKHLAELFNVALEKGKWRVNSECCTLLLPLNNSPVLTNW